MGMTEGQTTVARLVGPLEFRVESRLAPEQVTSRIREELEGRQTIELSPDTKSRRRLAGWTDGTRVFLTAWDDRLPTRRKSWNIELNADIGATTNGSVVSGTIDIPDRRALHILMLLFRVAAVIPVILEVGISLRSGRVEDGLAGFAVLLLAGGWFVTSRMERDGEIAAAEDARLVDRALRRLIGEYA
jgi:hypothetical protein